MIRYNLINTPMGSITQGIINDSTAMNTLITAINIQIGISVNQINDFLDIGDDVTTEFSLTYEPLDVNDVNIYIDGLKQIDGTDYNVSSTTVTFTSAPAQNSEITAFYNY